MEAVYALWYFDEKRNYKNLEGVFLTVYGALRSTRQVVCNETEDETLEVKWLYDDQAEKYVAVYAGDSSAGHAWVISKEYVQR